jgi:integrase
MPTVRKRGSKWQAQVRLKQGGAIIFSESATFDTEREARRWGSSLEAKVLRDGVESHYTQTTTVRRMAEAWLEYKEKIKPLSRGMSHSYKAVITAPFATRPLKLVNSQDYLTWGMSMKDRLDPATVLHHFMVLRSVFVHAESVMGFKPDIAPLEVAMSTLKRSRVTAKSRSRDRRISDDELAAIVLHFKTQMQRIIPMDDYVRLAVYLPRRREELLTMTWADYTGDTLRLRDTKHPTLTRDEIIPVPAQAKALIDKQPRFPDEPRILPYKPESVSAAFQRAVRAVGLADIRLHDLRHEGISRLFEVGLDIQEVALISGHVSWNALKRYTHLTPLKVLEKLNASRQAAQKAAT